MMLSENFDLSEFTKNFDDTLTMEQYQSVQELAQNLQVLRNAIGKPIVVSSGIRSAKHNADVGGVSNSQHLYGKAADIQVNGISPEELRNTIEGLILSGEMQEGGLGLYDSWVHYDIRGVKARWDNSSKKKV